MLRTNTCKVETSCYTSKRVVRANHNEAIVRSSEVHSTLISRKHEVHITFEDKEYVTPEVCKSSLTKSSSVSNSILIISKCNIVILSKFKAVKFILESVTLHLS